MFPVLLLALLGVTDLFDRFHYWGPFLLLILCGLGAPMPEEVALIGSGILMFEGHVRFVPITLVCTAAILLGDSLPFVLGRKYGLSALRLKWVSKVLHPERFAKFERRFAEHGNWAIFTCRFLPGLRIPGYFLAGTLRMSYARFLLLDGLGVLISVPTSIWAAYWLRNKFGEADTQEKVHDLLLWLAVVVIGGAVAFFVFRSWRRKRAEAKAAATAAAAPPVPPVIEPPTPGP